MSSLYAVASCWRALCYPALYRCALVLPLLLGLLVASSACGVEGANDEDIEPIIRQETIDFFLHAGVDTRGEEQWTLEPVLFDASTDWRQRYVFVCGEVLPADCIMDLVDDIRSVRVTSLIISQTGPYNNDQAGMVKNYLKQARLELFTPSNPTGAVIAGLDSEHLDGDAALSSYGARLNVTQDDITRLIMGDDETYSIRLRADVDPAETGTRWTYNFTVRMTVETAF